MLRANKQTVGSLRLLHIWRLPVKCSVGTPLNSVHSTTVVSPKWRYLSGCNTRRHRWTPTRLSSLFPTEERVVCQSHLPGLPSPHPPPQWTKETPRDVSWSAVMMGCSWACADPQKYAIISFSIPVSGVSIQLRGGRPLFADNHSSLLSLSQSLSPCSFSPLRPSLWVNGCYALWQIEGESRIGHWRFTMQTPITMYSLFTGSWVIR